MVELGRRASLDYGEKAHPLRGFCGVSKFLLILNALYNIIEF
jgi:hypothetical protein